MTKENAITWLEREQYNQWALYRGENEKVADYSSKDEDFEEGKKRLADLLELQSPGSYLLKAYIGHSKQSAANNFRFEIPKLSPSTTTNSHRSMSTDELILKAMLVAKFEIDYELHKASVNARLSEMEKQVGALAKAVYEVNDDDDENDESAMEKIGKIAEQIPAWEAGFKSFAALLPK